MLTRQELAERERRIRELERRRMRAAARECEIIVEMGNILIDTKAKHRKEWKLWAGRNLPFTYRTAVRYMEIAKKVTTLSLFFPLGRSIVYALLELDDKQLAKLTPDSVLKTGGTRKPIREMDCRELHAAVAALQGDAQAAPSPVTRGLACVTELARIKAENPAAWDEIDDDVAALLGTKMPEPARAARTSLKLKGKTRDERGEELARLLESIPGVIQQVDDVPGKLPPATKARNKTAAWVIWREANRLPAMATLWRAPAARTP